MNDNEIEKSYFVVVALMFGALVVMPWLSPGNRYQRTMANMRKEMEK